MNKISVLSLISFDHALLLEGIARYIDAVDEVILGLAADRMTWVGRAFEVPDSFFADLKAIDKNNKVRIVEEQFFQKSDDLIQNLTRSRNIVSNHAREDAWLITLDPDETIVNFDELVDFLRTFTGNNIAIFGKQVTMLKRDGEKTFVVENDDWSKDDICLATKKRGGYTVNRYTGEPIAFAPVYLINNSWARSTEDLSIKIGHSYYYVEQGFDVFLDKLNSSNYQQYKDFNPMGGSSWEAISLIEGDIGQYVNIKLDALRKGQAWAATSLYARANLFESKVAGRDASITELKVQHKNEIEKMRSEYEAKLASNVRTYKELKMQLDAELLANKARRER